MSGDSSLPTRRDIALLATIVEKRGPGHQLTKGFGNIIELSGVGLRLECNRDYDPGTPLDLSVVFPGQSRGDDPFAHLECVVEKIHDKPNLHYDLSIVAMSDEARSRLETYLRGPKRASAMRGS
ncbi:MAG: hypothetical protein MJE66_08895 [Proteobacteria bacterium]|nr:hypothetical protein [Pseudomonadota bacterium]